SPSPHGDWEPWDGKQAIPDPQIVARWQADDPKQGGMPSAPMPVARLSAEVVNVRLEPYRTAGTQADVISGCVDWKNTGNRPIRGVDATITGYDERGNAWVLFHPDIAIYGEADGYPGIAPGETCITPKSEGHFLHLHDRKPVRVTAVITKVEEKGF